MAASLINCITVNDYFATETEGDSPAAGTLATQAPPEGSMLDFPINGFYYLVVEALPDYKINASMVTVGENNSPLIEAGFTNYPNGHYIYNGVSESNTSIFPENLDEIRIYDSLGPNFDQCDNKVIVQIKISGTFVMPSTSVEIEIDLNGTAILCQEEGIEFFGSNYSRLSFRPIISTGGGNGLGSPIDAYQWPTIFLAQGFESETYAAGLNNTRNFSYIDGNYDVDSSPLFIPVVDNEGSWLSANPSYFTSNSPAIQGINPTWYSKLQCLNTNGNFGFWDSNNTNNIGNICGQLRVSGGAGLAIQTFSDEPDATLYHPNANENPAIVPNFFSTYELRFHTGNVVFNNGNGYLDPNQYPFLTPGDGILPSTLIWYISIGDNPNYNLTEDSIDIWKILTRIGLSGSLGGGPSDVCPSQSSTSDENAQGYQQLLISEKVNGITTENNSYLNIDSINVENALTPSGIEGKTVKITFYFNPNVTIDIWDQSFDDNPFFDTKIFMNVYPYENL